MGSWAGAREFGCDCDCVFWFGDDILHLIWPADGKLRYQARREKVESFHLVAWQVSGDENDSKH